MLVNANLLQTTIKKAAGCESAAFRKRKKLNLVSTTHSRPLQVVPDRQHVHASNQGVPFCCIHALMLARFNVLVNKLLLSQGGIKKAV